MADLTNQERLQPSLLDRLTDDEPHKTVESRDKRVLSLNRLRDSVMRDLAWLLNTGCLAQLEDLEDYPEVQHSVLNYGMIDLAGGMLSSTDVKAVEKSLKQALLDFEPRINRDTLRIRVTKADDVMNKNAVTFHIQGELWAQPVPLRLFLKTDVDIETGNVRVTDEDGRVVEA
ncbi:MAG: type VI secretion system baseplate subunit TssE [Candidatus Eisenbacteria bacterium]|uniref:Type VI secretion system baseplate subunit TssE n=1 Tax=Eiseniibacteriota bacterium TaxID=2212470 RepID=A0A7Y2H256_UNCEI|nr:type VI secretion system baseplate subunit TssE [Candidatus Eisenbacteria bacterium]